MGAQKMLVTSMVPTTLISSPKSYSLQSGIEKYEPEQVASATAILPKSIMEMGKQ